jgi:putative transposon-encoded protein
MPGKIASTEIKVVISEDVEEVLKRKVTAFGTGAKVGCPKEHIGKTVYLVVCKE